MKFGPNQPASRHLGEHANHEIALGPVEADVQAGHCSLAILNSNYVACGDPSIRQGDLRSWTRSRALRDAGQK